MKPKRAKGRNWTDKETRLFIELCSEYQMLSIKDGRLQTNIPRFKLIEEKMKEAGYTQSAKQLAIKFKQLKQLYYRTTNEIQYGETNSRFNYYEEMNALVAAAGNGLINDTSFNFDGAGDDDDSHEKLEQIDFTDTAMDESNITFQFDNNVANDSDFASSISISTENNIRHTRSSIKRSYSSSSNDDKPLVSKRTDVITKSNNSENNFHQDFAEQWYKQQSKLQQEFFEEQRKLLKSQKLQIQKQFFEEQLKLQQQQQKWMERMIKEERQNLNDQLKVMMNTFIEGVHRLGPSNMLSEADTGFGQNVTLESINNEQPALGIVEENREGSLHSIIKLDQTELGLGISGEHIANDSIPKGGYVNERRGYRMNVPEI